MRDSRGNKINLNDCITLPNGEKGYVVASIDMDEYSKDFPKQNWSDFKSGIIVKTMRGAIIVLDESHEHEVTKNELP